MTPIPNSNALPHRTSSPPWIGVVIVVLVASYLAYAAWPRSDARSSWQYRDFSRLPVQNGGRVMPIDTYARMTLMAANHRQTFRRDANDSSRPAVEWVLDAMVSIDPQQGRAFGYKTFRIENDELLDLIGLKMNPQLRYSFADISSAKNFQNFVKQAEKLRQDARNGGAKKLTLLDNKVLDLYGNLSTVYALSRAQTPSLVPPARGDDWVALREAVQANPNNIDPTSEGYLEMLTAYQKGSIDDFNRAVEKQHKLLDEMLPSLMSTLRLETYFDEFAPFYQCAVLDAILFLAVCLSWLFGSEGMRKGSLVAACLVLLVHTWAIVIRMYITGRPPVTNLYSSAVFIGWGCVLLCVGMEFFFRNGLALAVGLVAGSLSLLVAHLLGLSGDTMGVLEAVLDTNFWLATHVTCITFGYTATFVSGFLGIAYIVLGLFTRGLGKDGWGIWSRMNSFDNKDGAWILSKMIYGVICFAMFLSFTGTVLGGIWADQSWGRFWGWDPKENGALLIVIWNALILHARWAGLVKQRGVAVLAVAGNIITAWSWFGTNLLGIGLHSYGFMQGAFWGLVAFDLVNLVIIGLGLLPLERWRSFAKSSPPSVVSSEPLPRSLGGLEATT